jgi:hypothetical protein
MNTPKGRFPSAGIYFEGGKTAYPFDWCSTGRPASSRGKSAQVSFAAATAFTGVSLHHPCQDLERTQEVKVQVAIDACGGLSGRTKDAALRRIEAASLLRLPCGRRRGPPAD